MKRKKKNKINELNVNDAMRYIVKKIYKNWDTKREEVFARCKHSNKKSRKTKRGSLK